MFFARSVFYLKIKLLEEQGPSSQATTNISETFEGHHQVVVSYKLEVEAIKMVVEFMNSRNKMAPNKW